MIRRAHGTLTATACAHILSMDALRTDFMRDRKTKVVRSAPNRRADPVSNRLLHAGMNVLRLNCSHGDHAFYRDVIGNLWDSLDRVRHSMAEPGISIDFSDGAREDMCAVALDTKGPEIRNWSVQQWGDRRLANERAAHRAGRLRHYAYL